MDAPGYNHVGFKMPIICGSDVRLNFEVDSQRFDEEYYSNTWDLILESKILDSKWDSQEPMS